MVAFISGLAHTSNGFNNFVKAAKSYDYLGRSEEEALFEAVTAAAAHQAELEADETKADDLGWMSNSRSITAAGDRARSRLATTHIRLVTSLARNFRDYGFRMEDLTSAGCEGLMHAIDKFDPTRGVRFSTCAMWWIKAQIVEYILRNFSMVRMPNTKDNKRLFFNLKRIKREHEMANPYAENVMGKVAADLGMTVENVEGVEALLSGDKSMEAPVSNEDGVTQTLGDLLVDQGPSPEEIVIRSDEHNHQIERLYDILKTMGDRECDIFKSRRLSEEPMTLEALGVKYSVSKERIRQIEEKAMKKVTKLLVAA